MIHHSTLRTLIVAICALTLGLSSCCRGPEHCSAGCTPDDPEDPYVLRAGNLRVVGILRDYDPSTGIISPSWRDRDAIGITAISGGVTLDTNVKYTTMRSLGNHFVAATRGIRLGESESCDLIAYYPYSEALQEGHLLPVSTTSPLYLSRIKTGVTADAEAVLEFRPVLSPLLIKLSGVDLRGAKLELKGVAKSGKVNVTDGSVIISEEKETINAPLSVSGDLAGTAFLRLIPGQNLKGMTLRIVTSQYVFSYLITQDIELKSGEPNIIELKLKADDGTASGTVTTADGSILPMEDVVIDAGTIHVD